MLAINRELVETVEESTQEGLWRNKGGGDEGKEDIDGCPHLVKKELEQLQGFLMLYKTLIFLLYIVKF